MQGCKVNLNVFKNVSFSFYYLLENCGFFYFLIFSTCQSAEMLPAPITNGEERPSKEILVFTASLPRKYSYGFISH